MNKFPQRRIFITDGLENRAERLDKMLQDLVRAAVNEASRRVDEELANQMKSLVGGIRGFIRVEIPGMF